MMFLPAFILPTFLQLLVMCSHFISKRCTLRFVKPNHIPPAIRQTLSIGIGASFLDLGTVILAVIMNNQIMHYGDTNALAIYGVVTTITSLFQALFGGVGQAIQPIVSANYGAMRTDRIKHVWKMSFATVVGLGIAFTAIGELFPKQMIRLFIAATPEVVEAAHGIIRPFFLLFVSLGVTVLSTYYLQSTMQGKISRIIAILRSVVISGILLFVLPMLLGIQGVWYAMPASDLIVAIIALMYLYKRT